MSERRGTVLRGARAAALAVLALFACGLRAQALVLPPAPMSAEEMRAVYAELLHTHDGFSYTLLLLRYSSAEGARAAWDQLQKPPYRAQRLDRIYKTVKPWAARLFMLDPALRDKLVTLYEGERVGPVQTARGWVIAELQAIRPDPAPAFEQVEKFIPEYVASGTLPSAAQLQGDPALIARARANAVRTVDDLRAAPDLDVNLKLSSHDTLLSRAILADRLDLIEALLDRGANPNACARRFCPVQSAIYRGSRGAVDLLLKAGADPNQSDPAIGVLEGPLGAAAFRGDLELAARLLAGGAKVNGQGRGEPPLMAAASAANRPMVQLLLDKGADLFAVTNTAPARGALDSAERSKNAEFAAWLRGLMRARAQASGSYAWEGWIEQDGRRQAIDGQPVQLKRAPFRIVVRMQPERMLYVSASSDARLFEEFAKGGRDGALFSSANVSFESRQANELVVHEPQKPGARWGGSQAWWKDERDSRFASVTDTPQGREHARDIRALVVIDAADKVNDEIPVSAYRGGSLYLVLGTRIRMTFMDDEVFGSRALELKFQ